MFNIISKNNEAQSQSNNYTEIDLLPTQLDIPDDESKWNKITETNSMKDELKSFLKKQLKESSSVNESSTNISTLNSMSNANSKTFSYADF
jgi:hypothetical protein